MSIPDKKSIFKKTPFGVPRKDMRIALRKTPYKGTDYLRQFDERKERIALEKKLFPQKFGNYVNQKEIRTVEKGLRKEQAKTNNLAERNRIAKEINILKNIKKM